MQTHVVIIGGGFGGLTAAKGLAKSNVKVTLIDRSNHHLFQPLLYQVATAGLSPAQIAAPIRSILKDQKNAEVVLAEVQGIDPKSKKVFFKSGLSGESEVLRGPTRELSYDYLILATGSTYSYYGRDGWEKFAPGLKTVVDATKIRRKILLAFEHAEMEPDVEKQKALLTFALVGAGPTGVEMAGSIAELAHNVLKSDFTHIDPRHARIILIEGGPRILAGFHPSLAQQAAAKLQQLGVEIIYNRPVREIDENGVQVGEERFHAKTVIWCAGVVASPVGQWLGTALDRIGRVVVGPHLEVPEYPEVYVVGDLAAVKVKDKPLPGVAPVALQEGKYVAKRIQGLVAGQSPQRVFRYFDKGWLATVGRSFAIAEVGRIRLAGRFAWLMWVGVHVYFLIGFRNQFQVMLEWIWSYLTFQRGSRLITVESESGEPLKKLG